MRKIIIGIALILGVSSCDTSSHLINCDFDEQAMLENYADEIIVPRLSGLSLSLILLESSTQEFISNPSIGLLNEVRIFYGTAYSQYQECSAFTFGPGLISGVPFTERFNTFPTNVSEINQNISNSNSVETSVKSSVGFPALDYLLFIEPGTSNDDVLALYTTDALVTERQAYLLDLTTELKTTAVAIEQAWLSSGGNYAAQFISNTGTAEGTSIGQLVNAMNFDFETLKNFKFKIPLGKFNGGVVLPEKVEAYYAGGSALLARSQVEAFKKLFNGSTEANSNGIGLYEYLLCLETEGSNGTFLADEISGQFDVIQDAVNAISDPMSDALVSDFATVDNAYLQMQMMVPKIKYEMSSALGVQINYQDNDGD